MGSRSTNEQIALAKERRAARSSKEMRKIAAQRNKLIHAELARQRAEMLKEKPKK